MVPAWLSVLAEVSLIVAGLCALVVLGDVIARPQKMPIMNVVWPMTPLYLGLIGLWAYYAIGRTQDGQCSPQNQHSQQKGEGASEGKNKSPSWQSVFTGVSHCGAGCTLGDVIAEFGVYFFGLTLAGASIWPTLLTDFGLAYLFGILFQFFSIAPMRGLGIKAGLVAAVKADTLSIAAYEAGMLAWMSLAYFVFFHPHLKPNQPTYWYMMQIAMVIGFAASYPMNRWLIRMGLKEAM